VGGLGIKVNHIQQDNQETDIQQTYENVCDGKFPEFLFLTRVKYVENIPYNLLQSPDLAIKLPIIRSFYADNSPIYITVITLSGIINQRKFGIFSCIFQRFLLFFEDLAFSKASFTQKFISDPDFTQ
jgi:hypothetical protein